MRLAMLGPYPQNEGSVVGGPEAVVICLLKHLAALPDLELHMITCRVLPDHAPGNDAHPWTLHVVPRQRRGRLTAHRGERREIAQLIAQIRPDVVHAHSTGLYAAAALDASDADPSLPSVITVHGISFREAQIIPDWRERLRGQLDSMLERRNLQRARHLISISPYVQQELGGATRAQIHAIENPVEDLFFAVRRTTHPRAARILFAGRLIPRKGVHHLLAAFGNIAAQFPSAELYLAGAEDNTPGPAGQEYAAGLHRMVHEAGLEARVHFLGSLRMDQLATIYGESTCLVLPSQQETAPVVIQEAMASGCPVIATRAGGVPYQIEHERTGLLLDYGDVPRLTDHLRRLLTDPALCDRLSQAAQKVAQRRFRGAEIARQTHALYRMLVQQRLRGDVGGSG